MQPAEEPDAEFQGRMRELDGLLRDVEAIPDKAERERTGRIIQSLLDFHGAGVSAIVARLAAAGETGRAVMEDLASNDVVGSLLLLYGLHPMELESRVREAIVKVRPYLASHGGGVELVEVTAEGVVKLRMEGSGHGCPSSAATLKRTIEQAILETAPDAAAVEVEGVTDAQTAGPNGFVPIEHLTRRSGNGRATEGVLNHAS